MRRLRRRHDQHRPAIPLRRRRQIRPDLHDRGTIRAVAVVLVLRRLWLGLVDRRRGAGGDDDADRRLGWGRVGVVGRGRGLLLVVGGGLVTADGARAGLALRAAGDLAVGPGAIVGCGAAAGKEIL